MLHDESNEEEIVVIAAEENAPPVITKIVAQQNSEKEKSRASQAPAREPVDSANKTSISFAKMLLNNWQKAAEKQPRNPTVWFELGLYYLNSNTFDLEKACQHIEKAFSLQTPPTYLNSTIAAKKEDVLALLRSLQAGYPNNLVLNWVLGYFYLSVNPQEAQTYFSQATQIDKNSAAAWFHSGQFYFHEPSQNNVKRAFQDFKKAKEINPNYAPAWYALGLCHATGKGTTQNIEEAAICYQNAVNADKNHLEALVSLSYCHLFSLKEATRSTSIAFKYLQKAEKIDPNFPPIFGPLAYCYLQRINANPNPEKAHEYLKKITISRKENAIIWVKLGEHYLAGNYVRSDEKKAFECFEEAYNTDPECLPALRHLGNCFHQGRGTSQNLERAIRCYDQINNLEPGNKETLNFLKYLQQQKFEKLKGLIQLPNHQEKAKSSEHSVSSSQEERQSPFQEELLSSPSKDLQSFKDKESSQQISLMTQDPLSDENISHWQKLIEQQPGNAYAWFELGLSHLKFGSANEDLFESQLKQVSECLEKALSLNALPPYLDKTVVYKPEQAKEIFKELSESYPDNALFHCIRAFYLLKQDPARAFKIFKLVKEDINRSYAPIRIYLGICHWYGFGIPINYRAAYQHFSGAVKINRTAWLHLGECYQYGNGVKQDPSLALECYQKAIEADPHYALAWLKKGTCHLYGIGTEKDPQEATRCFSKATELDEKCTAGWMNLGHLHLLDQNPDTLQSSKELALQYFKKATEVDENCALAWVNLAYNHLQDEDPNTHQHSKKLALECLRKATKVDENYADAWVNLGYLSLDKDINQSSKAVECFQKAIKADKNCFPAWLNLGKCYLQGKGTSINKKEAIKYLRKAKKLQPEHLEINSLLAATIDDTSVKQTTHQQEQIPAPATFQETLIDNDHARQVHNAPEDFAVPKTNIRQEMVPYQEDSDVFAASPQHATAPYFLTANPQHATAPYFFTANPQHETAPLQEAPHFFTANPQHATAPYFFTANPQHATAPYFFTANPQRETAPLQEAPHFFTARPTYEMVSSPKHTHFATSSRQETSGSPEKLDSSRIHLSVNSFDKNSSLLYQPSITFLQNPVFDADFNKWHKLTQEQPGNSYAWFELGLSYLKLAYTHKNNFDQLTKDGGYCLEKALFLTTLPNYLHKTTTYNPEEAKALFQTLAEKDPNNSLFACILSLYRMKQKPIYAYQLLLSLKRKNHYDYPLARIYLGICNLYKIGTKKNSSNAYNHFSQTLKSDFRCTIAWILLADCHRHGIGTEKNLNEAFQCILKAIKFNGNCALAWARLGTYYLQGIGTPVNPQEALRCFLIANRLDKHCALVLTHLGQFHLQDQPPAPLQPSKKLALTYFEKAIAADENFAPALVKLGELFLDPEINQPGKAFEYFQKATQADKNYCLGWVNLAKCYLYRIGTSFNDKAAIQCLKKADKLWPENPEIISLFKIASSNHQPRQAIKHSAQQITTIQELSSEDETNIISATGNWTPRPVSVEDEFSSSSEDFDFPEIIFEPKTTSITKTFDYSRKRPNTPPPLPHKKSESISVHPIQKAKKYTFKAYKPKESHSTPAPKAQVHFTIPHAHAPQSASLYPRAQQSFVPITSTASSTTSSAGAQTSSRMAIGHLTEPAPKPMTAAFHLELPSLTSTSPLQPEREERRREPESSAPKRSRFW